jgi:hypothetical protein
VVQCHIETRSLQQAALTGCKIASPQFAVGRHKRKPKEGKAVTVVAHKYIAKGTAHNRTPGIV